MKKTAPLVAAIVAFSTFALGENKPLEPGFVSLFDGKSLAGWDGDKRFWRVENGAIVGQTTAEVKPDRNTFLIYRTGEFGDFELRFRYKCEGFNSGIQYRSVDKGGYVMDGLQADFEAQCHDDKNSGKKVDLFSGMFFEENGRMFMGQRGDAVIVRSNPADPKKPHVEKIGTVGDRVELEKVIKRDDWNDYTVIAKGNHFVHIINGHVMSMGIDEDPLNFRKTGLLGWQLHAGPPMRIDVKDVRIREVKE